MPPGQRVFELGKFDLEPGLDGSRARGEDVEDQLAAVEHFHAKKLFEIAGLRRKQIVVEDDDVGIGGLGEFLQFLDLTAADVRGQLNVLPLLREFGDDGGSRRGGEAADFIARIVGGPGFVRERDADENGLLAADGEIVALGVECFADVESLRVG